MRALAIVVMPSRHEGLPMVLLEAMAACRPVVATTVGGIPEVLEHGASGLLVPPESIEALTRATRIALTNPQLTQTLAQAAKRVAARYTARHMAAQVVAVYRTLEAES